MREKSKVRVTPGRKQLATRLGHLGCLSRRLHPRLVVGANSVGVFKINYPALSNPALSHPTQQRTQPSHGLPSHGSPSHGPPSRGQPYSASARHATPLLVLILHFHTPENNE
ncbi:Protein of unknown function [Gryllus bimaculatus]|nr:Protein of unknown function [Gryllus bimaculatus]